MAGETYINDNIFAATEAQLDVYMKVLTSTQFNNYVSQDQWAYEGASYKGAYTETLTDLATTKDFTKNDPHMGTLLNLMRFSESSEKRANVFEQLISFMGARLSGKPNNSVISDYGDIASFAIRGNSMFANKQNSEGVVFADALFDDFLNKVSTKVNNGNYDTIDGQWVDEQLFTARDIPGFSKSDFEEVLSNKSDYSNELTSLSSFLQSKYHTGEVMNGTRTPGIIVYKDGDDAFDSFIRRNSQDMSYTISHEYGHHTTLWFGSDSAAYEGDEAVSTPQNYDESTDTEIINTETLSNKSDSSMADGTRYHLFKEAFDSKEFRDDLDFASDGDTTTDLSTLRFTSNVRMGDMPIRPTTVESTGIDMGYNGWNFDISGISGSSQPNGEFGIFGNATSSLREFFVALGERTPEQGNIDFTNPDEDPFSIDVGEAFASDAKRAIETYGWDEQHAYMELDDRMAAIMSDEFDHQEVREGVNLLKAMATSQSDLFDIPESLLTMFAPAIPTFKTLNRKIEDGRLEQISIYEIYLYTIFRSNISYYGIVPDKYVTDSFEKIADLSMVAFDEQVSQKLGNIYNDGFLGQYRSILPDTYDKIMSGNGSSLVSQVVGADTIRAFYNKALEDYLAENPTPAGGTDKVMTTSYLIQNIYKRMGGNTRAIWELYMKSFDVQLNEYDSNNNVPIEDEFAFGTQLYMFRIFQERLFSPKPIDTSYGADASAENIQYLRQNARNAVEGTLNDSINNLNISLHPGVDKEDLIDAIVDFYSPQDNNGDTNTNWVFNLDRGTMGVDLNVFVFGRPENSQVLDLMDNQMIDLNGGLSDREFYSREFTAMNAMGQAPASFRRYQTTYAESLTRALNQVQFTSIPELLTNPGEYFGGDHLRFYAYGMSFYDIYGNDDPTQVPTGALTTQGQQVVDMFKSYFNTDRTIASLMRDKQTGEYAFTGFVNDNERDQWDGIAFTKHGTRDIEFTQDLIWDVDNYHYYPTHGMIDGQGPISLHEGRTSFMTDWTIMGQFSNADLVTGNYDLYQWTDKNGDGHQSDDELTPINNGTVANNGQLNSNGKIDDLAEVVGNPGHNYRWGIDNADEVYEIRVNRIKI